MRIFLDGFGIGIDGGLRAAVEVFEVTVERNGVFEVALRQECGKGSLETFIGLLEGDNHEPTNLDPKLRFTPRPMYELANATNNILAARYETNPQGQSSTKTDIFIPLL